MKKNILKGIFMLTMIICLTGCNDKPQTLNEEPSKTSSTTTTSTSTSKTNNTTASKEDDTTTTSKKTTSTTTSTTTSFKTTQVRTTSHWNQTTTKRYIIYKDGQTGQNGVDYYKDCDEDNKCRCTKGNGASIECPK